MFFLTDPGLSIIMKEGPTAPGRPHEDDPTEQSERIGADIMIHFSLEWKAEVKRAHDAWRNGTLNRPPVTVQLLGAYPPDRVACE